MRLATYRDPAGLTQVGLVVDDRIHPFPEPVTMLEVVEGGLDAAHDLARRASAVTAIPLADVRLLAPLQPASVRDFVAFEEHVEGVRRSVDGATGVPEAWYDAPTFYFTNPHAILGPDDDVAFPSRSVARDFELEVAAIVGRSGRSLTLAQASNAIFGYTIMNDWSARDVQAREMQVGLGPAKGKDFATTLGPWVVTADELADHRDADGFLDLWCSASVNGREVGRDLLSNAGWTFEAMLAYASHDSLVRPGDVLGSGTTGNGGCLAELWGRNGRNDPPALQPGDVVTLSVEGIGSISNRVAVAPPSPDVPAPRRREPAEVRRAVGKRQVVTP
ncbi:MULTISPECIES: fumarylacetoacetate hydrolase family protein [unclassified Kribbella]|uniref:fumarylacetoacetate hydrolase family protein n=1 Tax=unclassified Kribbella TaxID=2644121 RepID=UPI00307809CF